MAPSSDNQDATTEHPCRNHNITTCFHLIAIQMNKTEELLQMANQTLSTKEESPPAPANGMIFLEARRS